MNKKNKSETGVRVFAGKRKMAVAKASIKPGDGKITLSKIPYENLPQIRKLMIQEPIEIARQVLGKIDFDINVNASGGGQQGQIEAARLAIAKALVGMTKSQELRKAFVDYDRNLLIADTRRKEAYKPGDSKARRKRQKSYR